VKCFLSIPPSKRFKTKHRLDDSRNPNDSNPNIGVVSSVGDLSSPLSSGTKSNIQPSKNDISIRPSALKVSNRSESKHRVVNSIEDLFPPFKQTTDQRRVGDLYGG